MSDWRDTGCSGSGLSPLTTCEDHRGIEPFVALLAADPRSAGRRRRHSGLFFLRRGGRGALRAEDVSVGVTHPSELREPPLERLLQRVVVTTAVFEPPKRVPQQGVVTTLVVCRSKHEAYGGVGTAQAAATRGGCCSSGFSRPSAAVTATMIGLAATTLVMESLEPWMVFSRAGEGRVGRGG